MSDCEETDEDGLILFTLGINMVVYIEIYRSIDPDLDSCDMPIPCR